MPFLRQRYKQKPKQWGPFSAVQSALFYNAESMGIDPDKIAIATPGWEGCGNIAKSYGPNSYELPVNNWENNSIYHGASELITGPAIAIIPEPLWSIFLDVQYRGVTSVASAFLLSMGSSGDSFNLQTYYGGYRTVHYNNYSGVLLDVAGGVTNNPVKYVYTVRSDTDHRVFLDGANVASDTTTSVGQGDAWRTGFRVSSDSDNNWLINQILVFYSALSDNQIALLSNNPYQFWQPVPQKTIFLPLGGDTILPINVTVADGFSMSDSSTKQAIFSALAQESINMADTDQNIGAFISAIVEQLAVSDQTSKIATFPVAISDTFSFSDSVSVLQKIIGLVSDGVSISDAGLSRADFQAISEDSTIFADAVINTLQAQAVVSEIINLSDTVSTEALSVISGLVSETVNFSDASTSRADLVAAIIENFDLSDGSVNFLSALATATDTINLSDAAFWQGIQTAFVTDNLTVSDQAATIFQTFAGAAESIQFTDRSTVTATFIATANDLVQFAEVISNIAAFRVSVADGIRITATPMEVSTLPNGKVSVSFSMKIPGVDMEMKTATIVFNIK